MSNSTAVVQRTNQAGTSTALVPFQEMERMATAIAKSNLFGVKTVDQAVALMVIAQAEGRHPGSVANDYHIIQGRPSLKADTMLSRYLAAGGTVKWTSYTNEKVAAIFTHPQSGAIEVIWTMDMARSAGLAGKDNWKSFPRSMLRARVISEGVRTSYPGVSNGIYTPEEIGDLPAMEPTEPVNVTPGGDEQPNRAVEGELIQAEQTRGKPATQPPRAKTPASNKDEKKGLNAGQVKVLRAHLDHAGIPDKEFLRHFEIDAIEALAFDRLNDGLLWIKNAAGQPGDEG